MPREPIRLAVVLGVGVGLVLISGAVDRTLFDSVGDREEPSQRELDVGTIVGKPEHVLVLL